MFSKSILAIVFVSTLAFIRAIPLSGGLTTDPSVTHLEARGVHRYIIGCRPRASNNNCGYGNASEVSEGVTPTTTNNPTPTPTQPSPFIPQYYPGYYYNYVLKQYVPDPQTPLLNKGK